MLSWLTVRQEKQRNNGNDDSKNKYTKMKKQKNVCTWLTLSVRPLISLSIVILFLWNHESDHKYGSVSVSKQENIVKADYKPTNRIIFFLV